MGTQSLSVTEKLLLVAFDLEESKKKPFSAEDLVVAAWRMFPDTFGLAGYADSEGRRLFPDSNRVFAEIMGTKPIRKRGFLTKVGFKMYQITEAGKEHARLLLNRTGAAPVEKSGLSREVLGELRRLLSSKAAEKYRTQRVDALTFHDACSFWGISPRSKAIELRGRLANLESVLQMARAAAGGNLVAFEHGGTTFSSIDVDLLLALNKELLTLYKNELGIILRRTDERV